MDAMSIFVINVIKIDRALLNTGIIKGLVIGLESLLQQFCNDIFYSSVRDSCKKRNIAGRISMFRLPIP